MPSVDAFVPQGDIEVLVPIIGIMLHDVPKDRLPTDRDHRFWFHFRFFGQPGSLAASQARNLDIFSFHYLAN